MVDTRKNIEKKSETEVKGIIPEFKKDLVALKFREARSVGNMQLIFNFLQGESKEEKKEDITFHSRLPELRKDKYVIWWIKHYFGTHKDFQAVIVIPRALTLYGLVFEFGLGQSKNIDKAGELYSIADRTNEFFASIRLGSCLKDISEACIRLNYLINKNSKLAIFHKGILFEKAYRQNKIRGTKVAIDCFTRAAENGVPDAQFKLATLYLAGDLISQDIKKALFYYEIAAQLGHLGAMTKLGMLYKSGDLVAKDLIRASWYLRLAAENRSLEAQKNLWVLLQEPQQDPCIRYQAIMGLRKTKKSAKFAKLKQLFNEMDGKILNELSRKSGDSLKQSAALFDSKCEIEEDKPIPPVRFHWGKFDPSSFQTRSLFWRDASSYTKDNFFRKTDAKLTI